MKKDLTEIYRLSPEIDRSTLIKSGFDRAGIYRKWLYGKTIQLQIEVDLSNKDYAFSVIDICNHSIYIPYYNSTYSANNEVLRKVRQNVRSVFRELERKNVFKKEE